MNESNPFEIKINHSKTCSVKDCGKSALFYPVVLFWAKCDPKRKHQAIEVEVELQFCGTHQNEFALTDVPSVFQRVAAACKSVSAAEPDLTSATIEMRPLIIA